MQPRISDSSVNELSPIFTTYSQATPSRTIRIYEDSAGGNWIEVLVPLSAETVNRLRYQHQMGDIELTVEPLPDDDFRALEMTWLRRNYDRLAADYPGEWVAIDGEQLVAHADDLAALLELSRAAGHPNPFVTAVTAAPSVPLYF